MKKVELLDFFITNRMSKISNRNNKMIFECPSGFLDNNYLKYFSNNKQKQIGLFKLAEILNNLYKRNVDKSKSLSENDYNLFAVYTFEFLKQFNNFVNKIDSEKNKNLIKQFINKYKNIFLFKNNKKDFFLLTRNNKIENYYEINDLFIFLKNIRDFHSHLYVDDKNSIFNKLKICYFGKKEVGIFNNHFYYSSTFNYSKIQFEITKLFWIKIIEIIIWYISQWPVFKQFLKIKKNENN